MQKWQITETNIGQRLDVFLTEQLPDHSRSAIQKLIKEGSITIDGKPVTVHRFLKEGDEVVWKQKSVSKAARAPVREHTKKIAEPTIIAETADWLVIDKPAGLLVHLDAKTKNGTLVDWLMAHDPTIGRVGQDPERPGIVHRLDREVSGLMVIAKKQAAYDSLQRQFADRTVEKTYLALVHGELPRDEGDIKFRIARSATQPRMAARPKGEEEGRAAWTHYAVKERFVGATLLELKILSGRMHQIRAHLHALGHPVIGDPLYKLRRTDRNVTAPRLMLQSIGLEFDDPTSDERRSFQLDPDPTFNRLIEEFRHS